MLPAQRDMSRRRKPPTSIGVFQITTWLEGGRRLKSPEVSRAPRRVHTLCQARYEPPRQSRRQRRRVQTLKSAGWKPPNQLAGKDFRTFGEFIHSAQRDSSRRTKSPASSCKSHGGTSPAEQAAKKDICMTASSSSGHKTAEQTRRRH